MIFILLSCAIKGYASQEIIFASKSATALNTVTLYPDSTFAKHSNIAFEEGAFFELIGESVLEHEDDAQNQKFKWYHVKTKTGKTGWIYGDGLAVIVPDVDVSPNLRSFHKKKIDLDKGFEKALMWVASVEGRDNFHAKDYMNPIYNEYYLVITNRFGKSMHINISGVNARGKNEVKSLDMMDLTNDDFPEIILETESFSNESNLVNHNLAIYSVQSGTMAKVFDERLTLTYEDDLPSPSLSKYIEIKDNVIRVEYVDYLHCIYYQQGHSAQAISQTMERCMEYVTYSFIWNPRKKTYETLYEETRTEVRAHSKYAVALTEHPASGSKSLAHLERNEPLQVIKHFEKAIINGGKKRIENYVLVQTQKGAKGYLPSTYVQFDQGFHATILNSYYDQSPLSKSDWLIRIPFVKMEGERVVVVK